MTKKRTITHAERYLLKIERLENENKNLKSCLFQAQRAVILFEMKMDA